MQVQQKINLMNLKQQTITKTVEVFNSYKGIKNFNLLFNIFFQIAN